MQQLKQEKLKLNICTIASIPENLLTVNNSLNEVLESELARLRVLTNFDEISGGNLSY